MRPFGTRRVELNPFHMDSTLPYSPSSSGDFKGDKGSGETVSKDDIVQKDDILDTQVLDYEDETQPVDFHEETQLVDIAGVTQVMDDYDDLMEHMDTQVLEISDCETDGESSHGTQVLDDTVGLNDIQITDKSDSQRSTEKADANSACRQDDGGSRSELLPSDDIMQTSGSLRRGFPSVPTASLRAADLSELNVASDKGENEPCSTALDNGSSRLDLVNDGNDRVSIGGRAELMSETTEHAEISLGDGGKCQVARSLARQLFMEPELAKEGSNHGLGQKADFSPLPNCDDELGGLSYIDSQEPGELSQANALEFVNKFLKVNLLDTEEDVLQKKTASKAVNPGAVALGARSIALEASRRSSLGGKSIFEWDDKLEDEGGGDFFTKKKEILFGTQLGKRKSCRKPWSSMSPESKRCRSLGRTTMEKELGNVHDNIMSFLHSDSKLLKDRKMSKFEEMHVEKTVRNPINEQLGLDVCAEAALKAPTDESFSLLSVGIDTQIAAEAMEVLSTGIVLAADVGDMADQCVENVAGSSKKAAKDVPKKQNTVQQSVCNSHAGVLTRSKRNKGITNKSGEEAAYSLASRPSPQHNVETLPVDQVKLKVKRNRLNVNNPSGDREESSDREPGNVKGKATESNLEGKTHTNQSVAVKRRSSRMKLSTSLQVQQNTPCTSPKRNGAGDAVVDSGAGTHCLHGVNTKRRTRSVTASEGHDTRVKTDGSSDKVRHTQCTSEDNGIGEKRPARTAYGSLDVSFVRIARRTRSKRSTHSSRSPEKEKRLFAGMLSLEKALKVSSQKQNASSASAKGTLATVSQGGLSGQMQESSCAADVTPRNLKTPDSAVSPVCKGDEYLTPSCRKNLSLKKELCRLTDGNDNCSSPLRVLRQRRDMNSVRVLFSQHLDEDIVRQQRKILSRFGVPEAASILEATHFVADTFVRTRNMLEAIANAKFVVTHLWLECCGQSNSFIDEKNYILRDTKKEKELCFSMPISLARASGHPLLKDRRVFITPNVKPSKDVVSTLVTAVHGQAIGRLCRFSSNNENLLDGLLVLSCEEDFEVCMPLLERGIVVYSSELLLSGVVTQRLEYERHRLFVGRVKKTRSSLWLKDGDQFQRVVRAKK